MDMTTATATTTSVSHDAICSVIRQDDVETALSSSLPARDNVSPRSKWNELTRQMVATSHQNSPNHQHEHNYIPLNKRWRTFPNNISHRQHHQQQNSKQCRSDGSESPAKITSSQYSIENTDCRCSLQDHNRTDSLIQARRHSLDHSVVVTVECPLNDINPPPPPPPVTTTSGDGSILVDVSHLPDSKPDSSSSTEQAHAFVPIPPKEFCQSGVSNYVMLANDYGLSSSSGPFNKCQNQLQRQYKKRPRRLKVKRQTEYSGKKRKKKRRRKSHGWRSSSVPCDRIEAERRRRRNYKILHRRRASSVSVQKTRNVTKSMKCMLGVKKQRADPLSDRLYFAIYASFCFLPIGLASLFYSCKVKKYLKKNEREKAMLSSLMTRKLASAAVVCGLVICAVSFMYYFVQMTEPYAASDYDYYFPEYG